MRRDIVPEPKSSPQCKSAFLPQNEERGDHLLTDINDSLRVRGAVVRKGLPQEPKGIICDARRWVLFVRDPCGNAREFGAIFP